MDARVSAQTGVLAGVRILVVDDNVDLRLLIEAILIMAGAEVSLAGDGQQALEWLDQRSFDLLVCDADMPRLDGRELCRGLRVAGLDLPIVMVSGHVGADAAMESLAAGASAHLDKPFSIEALVDCCWQVLDDRPAR
jgi:CheY-like chemotaxis protein